MSCTIGFQCEVCLPCMKVSTVLDEQLHIFHAVRIFFFIKMKYPQLKQCLKRAGLLRINPFYGISLLKLLPVRLISLPILHGPLDLIATKRLYMS